MGKIRKPRKKDLLASNSSQQPTSQTTEQSILPQQAEADVAPVSDDAFQPKRRIWEVDFLRGFMILLVVWDHFMYDVAYLGGNYQTGLFLWLKEVSRAYYGGSLRATCHSFIVTLFVFTSGVSCTFSRNNLQRGIKMLAFALLLTAGTYAASAISGGNVTIRFNVLHVIAICVLLWAGLEFLQSKCHKNWQKNLFGVGVLCLILVSVIVGSVANHSPWEQTNPMWFFLCKHSFLIPEFVRFTGGDYLPLLPDLGCFLVGAFLGKAVYKQRKTLFPSVNEKFVAPIVFCGKQSLWVYFGSQIVMYGFVYLFSCVLGWL